MNLLNTKVGDRTIWINMANVTYIEQHAKKSITVHFNVGGGGHSDTNLQIDSANADAFLSQILANMGKVQKSG